MYEALAREKERRKLYTLPDTIRVLLSEKLKEDEDLLRKERREAWAWEWGPQTQSQAVAEVPMLRRDIGLSSLCIIHSYNHS